MTGHGPAAEVGALGGTSGPAYRGIRGPLPAVLDTCWVRSALACQLKNGKPPVSLSAAQDGTVRVFMERETLAETRERLPRFASQLDVNSSELEAMFEDTWLRCIRVVDLPAPLRALDRRADAVRARDADDYPAAALAALLSPCILLTHNHRDFSPLGVREWSQGVGAVRAAIEVNRREDRLTAAIVGPALPVLGVGAGTKWAAERIGPAAWVLLGLLLVAGIAAFRRQPEGRRDAIKAGAGEAVQFMVDKYAAAASSVERARRMLGAYVVAAPEHRTPSSAVLRELALASDSMSAGQLYEVLDAPVRPPVGSLRSFLHANKTSVFEEVRRGSFVLGRHELA